MTTEPKCLPECWKDHKPGPFQGFVYHAPGCPRAPGEVCWHCKDVSPRRCCGTVCCNCKRAVFHKPEPKQGSEEPIQPVTELEAEKSTSKILRTQLALAVAERDEARATKDMHKERQEEAWAEVTALRAEVEELKADKERRKGSAVDRLHNLCDGFDEMDKEQQAKIDALRAQLAEKEREIARLKAENSRIWRECERLAKLTARKDGKGAMVLNAARKGESR